MEIDSTYRNGKNFKKKGNHYLKFIIDRIPKEIPKKYIPKINDSQFYECFDSKIIKYGMFSNKEFEKEGIKWYVGIGAFFSLFIPISESFSSNMMDPIYFYSIIFIGLLFLIPAYIKWKKYKKTPKDIFITFDRKNGTITLPKHNQTSYFTLLFHDLKTGRINIGFSVYQIAKKPQLIFYTEPNKWLFDGGYVDMSMFPIHNDAQETWSYYVWYMDKNRPLPPGSAFDAFREKDFERRKAEGFPPPLYKSVVPTVEATPEQQQERENYWKDEDYMVDAKEAKYSLLDGFKDFKPEKKEKKKKKKKDKKK